MERKECVENKKPNDDFQKQLLQMSAEEIRYRLLALPFSTVQQIFYPVPKPVPAEKITIKVVIRRGVPVDLIVEQEGWKTLDPAKQVFWTCDGGKLEIRFDRKLSPFIADVFEVPKGAKAFSGQPDPNRLKTANFKYTVLVTTADGFFLKKDAEIVIERKSKLKK
jgi:hypothetical protein